MDLIKEVEQEYLRSDLAEFGPGDTVRVSVRIKEGDRERIQNFEGLVIAREGSGLNERITVRRISHQVGVERTFMLHSPTIDKVERRRRGRVRRAKLYYMRQRVGKGARVREQRADK